MHPRSIAVLLGLLSLLCCNAQVQARNWAINPGISLIETYSDNVAPGIAGATGADETDFITQINPSLLAEINGRRLQANLNLRLQNIQYARNNESDNFQQYLARGKAEVLPDHFFIDASSSLRQGEYRRGGSRE